jgi:hypothetical protein
MSFALALEPLDRARSDPLRGADQAALGLLLDLVSVARRPLRQVGLGHMLDDDGIKTIVPQSARGR